MLAPRRPLLTAVAVVAVAAVVAVVMGVAAVVAVGVPGPGVDAAPVRWEAPVAAGDGGPRGGARRTAAALSVLHRWDERRAAAYASGGVRALRRLYASPGAARRDVALLQSYAARGLVVDHMEVQVLVVRLLERRTGLVRLQVTERLVGAQVRDGSGAGSAVTLPVGAATTRVVTLRRVAGTWRVAAVAVPTG